jgi:phosphoglycolate phosphatase-like HAD superfamily hydrolase
LAPRRLRVHLVVFDMDGTLIDAAHSPIDDSCFWRAVREVFALAGDGPEWVENLRHVTATGMAAQFCEERLGREVSTAELRLISRRCEAHLANALADLEPATYRTYGSIEALAALSETHGFSWAIATGCFSVTAKLKLGFAGLLPDETILATSDDAVSPEEIMLTAAARASGVGREFTRFSYVGDGIWDLRAARNLGWEFIGIADGERAQALRQRGAEHVLPHFHPASRFIQVLA